MSVSFVQRSVSLTVSLLSGIVIAIAAMTQSSCGRSDLEIICLAHKYSLATAPEQQTLAAILDPFGSADEFAFTPPSFLVNDETHQTILNNPDGMAADRLHAILADATREVCRRTLEGQDLDFDFRNDSNNCDQYDEEWELVTEVVVEDDFDEEGPSVELNPACFAACLLDECVAGESGGDYDPPPEHPFARTVRCQCEVEEIGDCPPPPGPIQAGLYPSPTTIKESFCVPEGVSDAANYCRVSVADYSNASIRIINEFSGLLPFGGTCTGSGPSEFNVEVTCLPVDEHGNILTDAAAAYTAQEDSCEPGCSDLACADFQTECEVTILGFGSDCDPGDCEVSDACDCDLLPESCFEGDVVAGVCLPDPVGGADGGSDEGGGSPGRLKSAINVLAGEWRGLETFQCSQLEPGGSYIPTEGNPAPSSAVSPYALTNGTTFTTGLHHTCPAPTTDDVGISTFDTTLDELCRLIPLCESAGELELAITAREGATLLALSTLEKSGATITTTDAGAPLSVGEHTVDLCVEHVPSGVEACSAQSFRAAAPLGSGVDGIGYFAGELALDFVPIASKAGTYPLSLSDDGYARVSLPSGFEFPFYGTTVSTYLYVGANGGINTTNLPIAAANTGLPASTNVNAPDIAVYWDDLDPSSGGGVYVWFDGTRFIISWEGVPHGRDGSSSSSSGVNVQAHIYESGRIELHYLDTVVGDVDYDLGKSATLGIGNLPGTEAVEVTYDSNALLTTGVAAVGIARASDGCLADRLVVPPQVACAASDHSITVCTPSGDSVAVPLPDVSECAHGAVGVEGEVFESGTKESSLAPLSAPIWIDEYGNVELDEGAHRIRWWPVDGEGEHVGPAFTQLVLARTWVHDDCGGANQSMLVLTEDDDTYVATEPDALALIGRYGEDVLSSAAGDDFIGDGPDAGICEANEGEDWLVGEDGDDTLDAGPGEDRAWGGSGDDLLVAGAGADLLHGQGGHDILQGNADADALWGGLGDDVLEGGDGADTLMPGAGIDAVYGGAGDDAIVILAACELTSGKLLEGGGGTDRLVLPPGLDLQAVENAGVIVDADIESVETSAELPTHRATCEPS
jgi:Ca2+-binding RTX toxin-like protein